jgi:hypothetical protein
MFYFFRVEMVEGIWGGVEVIVEVLSGERFTEGVFFEWDEGEGEVYGVEGEFHGVFFCTEKKVMSQEVFKKIRGKFLR